MLVSTLSCRPRRWAQTAVADIFESSLKDGALGVGQHEVAFLNSGGKDLPEVIAHNRPSSRLD
jgi:hypothetical protein